MSLLGNLLKAGKGLIKAGRGSVDDILRNTPIGGAPVRQSVGAIDDVSALTGRSGQRLRGTRGAIETARNTGRSAPYVRPVPKPSLRTPPKGNLLKTGGGLMGGAGLIELGLMGIDAVGQAVNPEFARKRGIQQQYQDATGDPGYALTTEEMQRRLERGVDTDPLAMRARYGGSGDMDAGPGGPSTLSELTAPATLNGIAGIVDVDPKTGKGIPSTFRRGDLDTDDAATFSRETGKYTFDSDRFTAKPPASPTQTDLPPSSEQVAPVDPYAYQLSVYGQGRQAAASQEAQKKVADLGLAINRAMYPQFSRESYNPLMAATFPERYQKTPEDFVVQNGIQSPRSMINGDNSEALLAQEEENNIYKMDVAVDEVLKDVLNQARLRQQGS